MACLIDGGGNVSRPSLDRIWAAWYSRRSELWHWSMRRRLINVCRLLKRQAEGQRPNMPALSSTRASVYRPIIGQQKDLTEVFLKKMCNRKPFSPSSNNNNSETLLNSRFHDDDIAGQLWLHYVKTCFSIKSTVAFSRLTADKEPLVAAIKQHFWCNLIMSNALLIVRN